MREVNIWLGQKQGWHQRPSHMPYIISCWLWYSPFVPRTTRCCLLSIHSHSPAHPIFCSGWGYKIQFQSHCPIHRLRTQSKLFQGFIMGVGIGPISLHSTFQARTLCSVCCLSTGTPWPLPRAPNRAFLFISNFFKCWPMPIHHLPTKSLSCVLPL